MIFIKDLLNKIKWDERENPNDYSIVYYDRVADVNKEVKFTEIKEIGNTFILLKRDSIGIELPLHRIKAVKKLNKIIWKR